MFSMVKTASTMLPLGTAAPDFSLPDPSGKTVSLADFADSPVLLVAFICNHCPFVKHVAEGLSKLVKDYQPQGVAAVAINANDATVYPDDAPAKMAEEIQQRGYAFPYLYDATQNVAKAYRAACTPDFYVFDRQRKLVYRGQLDGSRPGNGVPVSGADLRAALDAALAGRSPQADQKPSIGCNIKWRPGNEPDYFG
jgi:peroxiredoxin